jgi:hypothetical protein
LKLKLTDWTTFRTGEYLKAPFLREFGITVPGVPPSVSVQLAPSVKNQVILLVALVLIAVAGAELLRR